MAEGVVNLGDSQAETEKKNCSEFENDGRRSQTKRLRRQGLLKGSTTGPSRIWGSMIFPMSIWERRRPPRKERDSGPCVATGLSGDAAPGGDWRNWMAIENGSIMKLERRQEMAGILDRIEADRDDRDLESKADTILAVMAKDRKRFEEYRKKTADMLIRIDRIEKRQASILEISAGGAILSLISVILSAAIVSLQR